MSISFTYDTLTAALPTWVEDYTPDLEDNLDNIIGLAELRLLKDLNLEIFDVEQAINIASGNPYVAKPNEMVALRSIWYVSGTTKVLLQRRSLEWLEDYWQDSSSNAAPLYYTEYSDTSWKVAPIPNTTYMGTARVIVRPAQLSAINTTTWLSINVGDALLFACLTECEAYLKDDPDQMRVKLWNDKYQAELAAAKMELMRTTRTDMLPLPISN